MANLFLQAIVPVARSAGTDWLAELKARYPMPAPPLGLALGLSRESAEQIIALGPAAADWFEGLVWLRLESWLKSCVVSEPCPSGNPS